jgi:septal ring factor EnvC (AmiA/AmiB activator)
MTSLQEQTWRRRGGTFMSSDVIADMQSEIDAMRRRLSEQGRRPEDVESNLKRLREELRRVGLDSNWI